MRQTTGYLFSYSLILSLYLLGVTLAPGSVRWLLAPTWGAAALLNYLQPDQRGATTPYILMSHAALGLILLGYRIAGLLAGASTEPTATLLYSTSLWLLGFGGLVLVGYYAYILRFLFWQRGTPWGGGRQTAARALASLTRTPRG